jgi:hypothetical protein
MPDRGECALIAGRSTAAAGSLARHRPVQILGAALTIVAIGNGTRVWPPVTLHEC